MTIQKNTYYTYKETIGIPGYLTVETACVFVTVLSVIVFLVSAGIYKYQNCVFELESYCELEKSIYEGKGTQDYVRVKAGTWSIERQGRATIQAGVFGMRNETMYLSVNVRVSDPILVLRMSKRIQRAEENEDRESEPSVFESDG